MSMTGAARFNPSITEAIDLPEVDSWPATRHRFTEESVWAIKAALAARRPLLIRGEPGIGKSQLARAAAAEMKAPFLSHVINARTETDELLYSYDAVTRLARAQLMGARRDSVVDPETELDEARFVRPGCLWWAFNWESAAEQLKKSRSAARPPEMLEDWDPRSNGCVILIDEIDKADSDVPNSLLESLGNTGFYVPYTRESVALSKDKAPPLVVITTNEERELPAAFLRRCLVYQMSLPKPQDECVAFLIERGRVHFTKDQVDDEVCEQTATLLLGDREKARRDGLAIPGFAEYRDLLAALVDLCPGDSKEQVTLLHKIAKFALRKNPEGDGV